MALDVERVQQSGLVLLEQWLERAGLPHQDIGCPGRRFYQFTLGGALAGFGGLEGDAPDVLLRSIMVAPGRQRHGEGGEIVRALERLAAETGARTLHVLTASATPFFQRHGYRPALREHAPPGIAASRQMAGLCPSSAAYLVKALAA